MGQVFESVVFIHAVCLLARLSSTVYVCFLLKRTEQTRAFQLILQ